MQIYTSNLKLRPAPASRFRPPFVSRRREVPSWRLVALAALPLLLVPAIAYVARRRLFQGIAVLAEAVEGVADAVEDAAEDAAKAARARADSGEATE